MTLLNLTKRNSEVSVLVQAAAKHGDLTFPTLRPLALRLLRAQGPTQMAVFAAGYIGVGCQMSCVLDLSC
jgi:hypothetical protein